MDSNFQSLALFEIIFSNDSAFDLVLIIWTVVLIILEQWTVTGQWTSCLALTDHLSASAAPFKSKQCNGRCKCRNILLVKTGRLNVKIFCQGKTTLCALVRIKRTEKQVDTVFFAKNAKQCFKVNWFFFQFVWFRLSKRFVYKTIVSIIEFKKLDLISL